MQLKDRLNRRIIAISAHIPRIYQPVPLSIGTGVSLTAATSHHLAHVLRCSVGDSLILFNGERGEYEAKITSIKKQAVAVQIKSFRTVNKESPVKIHLGQSLSRGEKMDFAIQKAVELGITEITPLLTDFCAIKCSKEQGEKKLAHWQKIIVSACEQCGRDQLPILHPIMPLDEWIQHQSAELKFVLHPTAEHHLKVSTPPPSSIALLIGAEGGLSDNEVELAKKYHFLSIQLGPRILRTETATLSALTLLQFLYGDLC